MSRQDCPRCHSGLQPHDTVFCTPCYLCLLEQHTWSWVERLFAYCEAALDGETADVQIEAFRIVWETWTATLPSIRAASTPTRKPLDKCVAEARQAWSAFKHAEEQYVARVKTIPATIEFTLLLHIARDMRQVSRECLLQAFRFDIQFGRSLQEACDINTEEDAAEFIQAVQCYGIFSSIWEAGLRTVLCLTADGKEPQIVITEAVLAMRSALSQAVPLALGTGMNAPSDPARADATIALSGWARTHISLAFGRFRDALSQDGDPQQALLQRLPANTYQAWRAEGWATLKELCRKIAFLIEHDGSERRPQESLTDESVQVAPQSCEAPTCDNPTYEAVARKLEEEDQYMAWLIKEADLKPHEAMVVRAKMQSPPSEHTHGYFSDQEVADMLGCSLGSVKQALLRARPKMRRVINQ